MEKFYEGWLIKSPPEWKTLLKIIKPKWRRRYFVLYSPPAYCLTPGVCHAMLSYYDNESLTKEYGKIDLSTCEEMTSKLETDSYSHVLSIKTTSKNQKRTYYLAAGDDDELGRWTGKISSLLSLSEDFIETNACYSSSNPKSNGLKPSLSCLYKHSIVSTIKRASTDIGNKVKITSQKKSTFYRKHSKERKSIEVAPLNSLLKKNSVFMPNRRPSCPSVISTLSRGSSMITIPILPNANSPRILNQPVSPYSEMSFNGLHAFQGKSHERDTVLPHPNKESHSNDNIFRISEYEDEIPCLPHKQNSTIATEEDNLQIFIETLTESGETPLPANNTVANKNEKSPIIVEKVRNNSSDSIYDVPSTRLSNSFRNRDSKTLSSPQLDFLTINGSPNSVNNRENNYSDQAQDDKEDYDYLPCFKSKQKSSSCMTEIKSPRLKPPCVTILNNSRDNSTFSLSGNFTQHLSASSLDPDYDYLPTKKSSISKPSSLSNKTKNFTPSPVHAFNKVSGIYDSPLILHKSTSVKHTSYSPRVPIKIKYKHTSRFSHKLSESSDQINDIFKDDEVIYDQINIKESVKNKNVKPPITKPKPKLEFLRYNVDTTCSTKRSVYKKISRSTDFLSSAEMKEQDASEDGDEPTVRLTSGSKSFKRKKELNIIN